MIRLRRLLAAAACATAVTTAVALLPVEPAPGSATRHTVEAAGVAHSTATQPKQYELYTKSRPDRPYRWPACRAIDYRIDTRHAPKGVATTIRATMAAIGTQTGVTFRDAGTHRRSFTAASFSRSTPTIYFSFGTDDGQGNAFGDGGEVGSGGPSAAWERDASGRYTQAVLFGRVQLWSGWSAPQRGAGVTWQSLITHEVGHALNLAHRDARRAAMNPTLTAADPGRFSASELRALSHTLQTSGCDYSAWRSLARHA